MSLYGYPREPDAADVDVPAPDVPHQRFASEPVAVKRPGFAATESAPDALEPEPTRYVPPAEAAPFGQPAPPGEPAPLGQPAPPGQLFGQTFGDSWPAFGAPGYANGYAATGTVPMGSIPTGPGAPYAYMNGAGTSTGSATGDVVASGTASVSGFARPVATPEPTRASIDQKVEPRVTSSLEAEVEAALDVAEIAPWDRKPLIIVIAAAAVLVLIAIVSGVVIAALLPGGPPAATWRDVQPGPSGAAQGTGPAVAPPPPSAVITLSGVGDVIMGTAPGNLPPNDGVGFFDPVKSALASDLVMGNLETPLTEPTGYGKCGDPPSDGCFQFSVPPSYANRLRDAGFQVLNLANNHTNDMGPVGLTNTRNALTAAGIQPTGGVGQIAYATVKDMTVAVLGFSVYSWGANLNDIPAAVGLVKEADAKADLVVIQMQGGAEGSDQTHVRPGHENFLGEDRGDLIEFSHAVIDAGADVVFGHGPHIMRGMEFYKGRLIAYSLGNFCGYRVLSGAGYLGVGGVLKVSLRKDGTWAGGTLVATEMVNGGIAAPDDDKRALGFVAGLSREDFGTAAPTISLTDGTITPPGTTS